MFRKKRKIGKYRPTYGYKPVAKLRKKAGVHRQSKKIKKPHPKFKRLKNQTIVLLISASLIGLSYLIFLSSYFKIKEIQFSEDSFTLVSMTEEIQESLNDQIGKNLIFTDLEALQQQSIENFPKIAEIKIEKDYPDKLIINFKEFESAANIINVTNNIKKSYIINEIGFVIREDFENPALPYIKIETDEPINLNDSIINKSNLSYILESKASFEEKFDMNIAEIVYKPVPREVHLLTEKDFYIWLDIQRPYEDQLKKLKKIVVKLDIYNEALEYIDLRIAGNNGDKIIYKRK
jgi:hypothetical protein